jgi:hypothetical protein
MLLLIVRNMDTQTFHYLGAVSKWIWLHTHDPQILGAAVWSNTGDRASGNCTPLVWNVIFFSNFSTSFGSTSLLPRGSFCVGKYIWRLMLSILFSLVPSLGLGHISTFLFFSAKISPSQRANRKEVVYFKEVFGNRDAIMFVRYCSAQKNNLLFLVWDYAFSQPGLLNLLYDVDNFGKIWFACGQHEIQ